MADKNPISSHELMTMGAKQYFFAARAVMEAILRPFDLGSMQWYVLYKLANDGPISQRELAKMSGVERATLSDIVILLVQKGLIAQTAHSTDQRQKMLEITGAGKTLWSKLPDPTAIIMSVAFEGVAEKDIALTRKTLMGAAEKLTNYKVEGKNTWKS